jgi:hypothetical protein
MALDFNDYTPNDQVDEIIYEKNLEIKVLRMQITALNKRIDKYRNSIIALKLSIDEDYANGF